MDFWRTVLVLFRRWYVTVPAFLASLVLAGMAYSTVPPVYQSGAVLVLTTPLTGSTETSTATGQRALTNPMLNFDHSLSLAGAILIQQMNSPGTAARMGVAPGGPVNYQVTNGSSNPELLETGPFVFVQGTGPTPQAAQAVTTKVADTAIGVLARRQNELGAPASTHIDVQVVVPPTDGALLSGTPIRAAAAALALGGIGCLTIVYGFESLMTHRRPRKGAASQDRKDVATMDSRPRGSSKAHPVDRAYAGSARSVRDSTSSDSRARAPVSRAAETAVDIADVIKQDGRPVIDGDGANADDQRGGTATETRGRTVPRGASGSGR